jgi:hypothetical protein
MDIRGNLVCRVIRNRRAAFGCTAKGGQEGQAKKTEQWAHVFFLSYFFSVW